ncbi:hypothetical protein HQN89_21840 [Paenibacillus frigoriresistens]|uniref:hypothetical protein n=1 Tax=Paenibacillus alginolyticus TaxID=59839 RepID=UPI001564614A|nr:hypothetical protein [Paenibacillus frigoriresistens]NRF93589.1 hypothetical protein [Paenibacillus frigoriresistens]
MIDRDEELIDYLAGTGELLIKQSAKLEGLKAAYSNVMEDLRVFLMESNSNNHKENEIKYNESIRILNLIIQNQHMQKGSIDDLEKRISQQFIELQKEHRELFNTHNVRIGQVEQDLKHQLNESQRFSRHAHEIDVKMYSYIRKEIVWMRKLIIFLSIIGGISCVALVFILSKWIFSI